MLKLFMFCWITLSSSMMLIPRNRLVIRRYLSTKRVHMSADFPHWTAVNIPPSPWKIDHSCCTVMIGSCFVENISKIMKRLKFSIASNPQGILFNPKSILQTIENISDKKSFSDEDLFFDPLEKIYHSWQHHSSFSRMHANEAINEMNSAIADARDAMQRAKVIFITLGSSKVYYLKEKNIHVANCHKQPQKIFEAKHLEFAELKSTLERIVSVSRQINPNIQIVFTVSPIRHIRDGLIENMHSKATLIAAIHEVIAESNRISSKKVVGYFPAYELMIDQLRDYRWYEKDMIHPSSVAIEEIFRMFSNTYFSVETIQAIDQIEKLLSSIEHRPRFPDSPAYKKHIEQTIAKAIELSSKYNITFQDELRLLQ